MDQGLNKKELFVFNDPDDSTKKYYRHYVDSPANGNTFLVIGAFAHPMDFTSVFLILNSYYYGVPYLAIDKFKLLFENPDTLAKIIAKALNWALKKYRLEVLIEPWNAKHVRWCLDYKDSKLGLLQELAAVE